MLYYETTETLKKQSTFKLDTIFVYRKYCTALELSRRTVVTIMMLQRLLPTTYLLSCLNFPDFSVLSIMKLKSKIEKKKSKIAKVRLISL